MNTENKHTIYGIIAILLWSTTIASFRGNAEDVGIFTAGAYVCLIGGFFGLLFEFFKNKKFNNIFQLPLKYLVICGYLFIQYVIFFYLAIGISNNYNDVQKVTIINYLWPSLTLVFSIFILKKKTKPIIIIGILLAFSGVLFSIIGEQWSLLSAKSDQNYFAYSLALIASISWALYSNLVKKYAENAQGNGVHLFFIISGLILLGLKFTNHEATIQWTPVIIAKLLYTAILPGMLASVLWDFSMRKGNMTLIVSLAYFIPLISTVITSLYFQINIGVIIWISCLLIICGAYICNRGIIQTKQNEDLK